jgi:tetratricopeptide (TPR) repeat protein
MTEGQTLAPDDYKDLAASLERDLERCDDPTEADELRLRLARIYLGVLPDLPRAVAHAEELLGREDVSAEAFQVAGALLDHAEVAPRAAELLSSTYARLGRVDGEAAALARELEIARAPRGDVVRRRLVELRHRELGDPAGAMELAEPLVTKDPGDDELRALYVEVAHALGSPIRAAETLSRAAKRSKSSEVRERVGFEVANLYLREGELHHARTAFLDVVLTEGGGPLAVEAAERVLGLENGPSDPLVAGAALETIARGSQDGTVRQGAAAKLLTMHETTPFKEARLVVAYQALVDSDRADEALAWLRAYHERHGDKGALAAVYQRQALRASDEASARALALKSIELRAGESDGARAEHWLWFVRTYGPDRRAHAELLVLLEQARRVEDLCRILEAEVALATPEERPALLARLGRTHLVSRGDPEAALAALGQCLALDATNETARSIVESLMAAGNDRLAAADVLEPIYRATGNHEGELHVLETRADLLTDAQGRVAVIARAVDVAGGPLGDSQRALQLCRQGLELDPASPELLQRLDELVGDTELPADRLTRYRSALEIASPAQRAPLLRAIALLLRDTLGDLRGAVEAWEQVVADDPTDLASFEALAAACGTLGDAAASLAWLERARAGLRGADRDRMTVRTARALIEARSKERALALCREVAADADADPSALEDVAEMAWTQGDADLYRQALGHMSLVDRYAVGGDWARLPDALRVWLDRGEDLGGCVLLLLRLESSAIEAAAVDAFVSLADDLAARIAGESRGQARALSRAKARVLASDAERPQAAAAVYRKLVEEFADDEVVRDYEAFADATTDAKARHELRRWLFGWRAEHEPRPVGVVLAWAKSEEEYGAGDAAIVVYERLAAFEGERRLALEAVCRLKLHAGDLAGGLDAYRALRDESATDQARLAIDLTAVRLLSGEQYPVEAAAILAPTLAIHPPIEEAHELARQMLADPASRNEVATRIAETASSADDVTALRIYNFLLAGGADEGAHRGEETAARSSGPRPMGGRRRQWYQRVADLARVDPEAAFSTGSRGVLEFPDAIALWDGLERVARDLGRLEEVPAAYRRVLVEKVTDAGLAESLGRRMVHFEEACAMESAHSTEALLKVLELAPGARWALDRVKLTLGAQARYDDLFAILDRAIEAAADDRARADLLSEAAFAARDLAGLPERAIVYLTGLFALRPDDAQVESSLERLYERQGHRVQLIGLLEKRVSRTTGFKRRDLRRRIVSSWLDLGEAAHADVVLEALLAGDAFVADVVDLLERVLDGPAPAEVHDRTAARLRAHYESLGRVDELVRVAERSLVLAGDAVERARRMRDLVALRLRAAAGSARMFGEVAARLDSDVAGDRALAKTAYKALLLQALYAFARSRRAGGDATDAADGAYTSILKLRDILLDDASPAAAFALLRRGSRVPFDTGKRRGLLCDAAIVCAERLGDAARAVRLFDELYAEDPGDDFAARSLGAYAGLLESTGQTVKLATVWEQQAELREKAGSGAEERACWERAAALWEREGAWAQAIGAYRRGAGLGSEASFEALARIHAARAEWGDAAKALEWLFSRATQESRGARALKLTEAYVALDRRDQARAWLEETLKLHGEAPRGGDLERVREQLIELYRRDGVWLPLARLLADDARRADDPRDELALLREAADLYRSKLAQPDEAAGLLQGAVALDPGDSVLRGTLVEVLEARGRWEESAAVLAGQIALYGEHRSRDRAVVHRRLAHALVQASRLEDAFTELRHAVEMFPSHPGSLFDLARVALDLDRLDLSERTYRALLLVIHGGEEGSGPSRMDVFVDLSEVALRRGDEARAADLIDSAFDEGLERGEDPSRLEGGLRARGRHALLARALERRVERGATLGDRASALADLTELWATDLGKPIDLGLRLRNAADRIARDLGHEDATDSAPWSSLATVYGHFDDARPALLPLLETAIPKVQAGADRGRLRVLLAKMLLALPDRTDAAIAALRDALADDPSSREGNQLLTSVLESQGRVDELVGLAERRLAALPAEADPRDFVDAAWKLAGALEHAGRPEEALPVYESVLDREPTDPALLRTLAERLQGLGSRRLADCLERWLRVDRAGAGGDVARRLLELRDEAGDTAGSLRALGIAAASDRGLLLRFVEAHRKAGDERQALEVVGTAIETHPAAADLLVLRSGIRERAGDADGAVADLEAAGTIDAKQVNALLELLGRIAGADDSTRADAHAMRLVDTLLRLNRPKQARRELERLLARNPQHADALGKSAALAAAEGSWEAAASAYRKLLLVVEKGSDRAKLASVAVGTADASERAGQLDLARDALGRAIDVLSRGPEMAPELERLCRVTKDWGRLAAVFVARADAQEDAGAKTDLLLRAGRVMLDECHDPAAALTVLDRCRAIAPENLEVLVLWARGQVATGQPHAALRALYDVAERNRGKRSPALANVYLEIGKAHLAGDELAEALDALDFGFAVDWRVGDLAMLLGLVALDLGEDKVAVRAFSAVTTLPPKKDPAGGGADAATKAVAFYHLASIAMAQGDITRARRLVSKAVGGDPAHGPARALYDSLNAGAEAKAK